MVTEHAPVQKRHAWRATAVFFALLVGTLLGVFVGLWSRERQHMAQWQAALAGIGTSLLVVSVVGACVAVISNSSSARRAYYGKRAKRHDGCNRDWRHVIGTTTNLHQSSPNSLYDLLYPAKGVTPSRDPTSTKPAFDL